MNWRDKLQVEGMDSGDRSDRSPVPAIAIAIPADALTTEQEAPPEPESASVPWPEWKAAEINRLFKEKGVTGQPGRITAATIRESEASGERVDSAAADEPPMSQAEATQ